MAQRTTFTQILYCIAFEHDIYDFNDVKFDTLSTNSSFDNFIVGIWDSLSLICKIHHTFENAVEKEKNCKSCELVELNFLELHFILNVASFFSFVVLQLSD